MLRGGVLHDFDAGKGVDALQGITALAHSTSLLSFQWDQPWFSVNGNGSASDLDIYFVDDDDPNALVCQFPGDDENAGGDAVKLPALINDSEEDVHANIAIELFSGPAPRRMTDSRTSSAPPRRRRTWPRSAH
jgi:hypothetical protein